MWNWKQNRMANAFTLIEMMVVMGMLAILMGAAFSGLSQARKQAKITKANAELRELINSILAYEAAEETLVVNSDPVDATESNLQPLLGNNGGTVYLNAPMVNKAFRDPWGNPYRYRVVQANIQADNGKQPEFSASVTFPNRYREIRW